MTAQLRSRRSMAITVYDASILAAALDAGCDVVYSEDMQNDQRLGTLTIRNPFL